MTAQLTREFFADQWQACIDEVARGDVRVNDPDAYYLWCGNMIIATLAGEFDHTFTFQQRAHYIQTGKMIALLP